MIERDIEIINKLGLHARAATKLVKLASSFGCQIDIQKGEQRVNAKSIMGVMMLAASRGNVVQIYTDGSDEKPAMEAVDHLFADKFGEEE